MTDIAADKLAREAAERIIKYPTWATDDSMEDAVNVARAYIAQSARVASMLTENAAQSDMLAVQTERAEKAENTCDSWKILYLQCDKSRDDWVDKLDIALARAEKAEVRVSVLQNGLSIIADWDKAPITGEGANALLEIIESICDRARRDLAGVRPWRSRTCRPSGRS